MRNIFIFALLFAALLLSESSMTCKESRKLHDTCGGYCFQAVKSILGHTAMLQEQVNSRNSLQQTEVKSDLEGIKRQLSTVIEQTRPEQCLRRRQTAFKKIGSKFYYIEGKEQLNWFAAAHRCHELGGHLVSLQSEKEHVDLKAQLNTTRNYWTDINDLSKEGVYLSLTTGMPAPYLSWKDPSNPDNSGNAEHCVHLYRTNFLMNDNKCSVLFHFVCELFD